MMLMHVQRFCIQSRKIRQRSVFNINIVINGAGKLVWGQMVTDHSSDLMVWDYNSSTHASRCVVQWKLVEVIYRDMYTSLGSERFCQNNHQFNSVYTSINGLYLNDRLHTILETSIIYV